MTIKVRIGEQELDLAEVSDSWIHDQLRRRRQDGQNVCLQVSIHTGSLNMLLSTPGCRGGEAGSRRATEREQRVFDLWERGGMGQAGFQAGDVVGFLQALRRFL